MAATQMAQHLSVRVDGELEERLKAYIEDERHVFEPGKSKVVREALDEFLPPLEELED